MRQIGSRNSDRSVGPARIAMRLYRSGGQMPSSPTAARRTKRIGAIELLRCADRVGEVAVGGFLPGALVARSVDITIGDHYELAMNRGKVG
jgi:hypothetical protein